MLPEDLPDSRVETCQDTFESKSETVDKAADMLGTRSCARKRDSVDDAAGKADAEQDRQVGIQPATSDLGNPGRRQRECAKRPSTTDTGVGQRRRSTRFIGHLYSLFCKEVQHDGFASHIRAMRGRLDVL